LRYGTALLITLTVLFISRHAEAQSQAAAPSAASVSLDAASLVNQGATEWMTTIGNAWAIDLFHSVEGHRYLSQTLSWGKVLTGATFPGALRGRFEWAVEVTPVFGQYQPDAVYGVGVSPFTWRWNFEPRGRYAPFAELGGGALWTSAPVPQRTTRANFTAHVAVGLRRMIRPTHALVVAYRFDHISNGNRLERNPAINAHGVHVGWSLIKRRQ
jgi:hypothetical protein